MITVVVVQDQHRVPRITGKLCTTENLLVHLLVQTKSPVISGEYFWEARPECPYSRTGLGEGPTYRPVVPRRPNAPLWRVQVPPGGGEKTIVLSKAISAIAITTAAVRPALRRGQQEHQEQQQGRSNCRDAGSRPALRRGQQEHHHRSR